MMVNLDFWQKVADNWSVTEEGLPGDGKKKDNPGSFTATTIQDQGRLNSVSYEEVNKINAELGMYSAEK